MKPIPAKFIPGVALMFVFLGCTLHLEAQTTQPAISGTVTNASGQPVGNASVTIKNEANGESLQVNTDSAGRFSVPDLGRGDYNVFASADGSASGTQKVTVAHGAEQKLTLRLTPKARPAPVPGESLPSAPAPNPQSEPSLSDLGFSSSVTQSNAKEQALLDKRTHMLRIHQRMGLITTVPMVASVISSLKAGGRNTGTASRDLHVALGALTGDLYGITAYYAIRAPRIPGTETHGQIKFHKAMAWIHGPGMILTPILGAIAFEQKNNNEKVHGIAKAHGPVAIATAGAFGAALLSVSVKF